MHGFKKALLVGACSVLLPLSAMSADDDGTFTITIQGPDVEETQPVQTVEPVAPRRVQTRATPRAPRANVATPATTRAPVRQRTANTTTTPRATTRATQATTTPVATSSRNYAVRAGDTIWSVAHSLVPTDKSLNEFQIIASIYRNNPQAFDGGNVNNLRRTTIRVPDNSQIAMESTQVGSQLLNQGSIVLPPLVATVETRPVQNVQTPTDEATRADIAAKVADTTIPVYTATETKIKELEEQQSKDKDDTLIQEKQTNKDAQNHNEINHNVEETTTTSASEKVEKLENLQKQVSDASIDVNSIRIMLDQTKQAIDEKTKGMESQLAEALDRMKKSSAVTAQTASDSVASLSSQYDNIIAGIQQDLIEIKGAVSKLSQDNDRMREMLLANDEKIEDMQLQLSQFSVSTSDTAIDIEKPVMKILFGSALLSLVLLILFLIFKAKARAHVNKYADDFDVDDSLVSEESLLSDDNGSIEIEKPVVLDEEEENKDTGTTPETSEEKNTNAIDTPAVAPEGATNPEEQTAQNDWDNAAKENSDKAVLDDWSKALDESNASAEKPVDVKSSDEDVAAQWEAALGEQDKGESDAPKSEDEMAASWAAALDEQDKGESDAPKSEDEMAASWAAALDEQDKGESDKPKSEEEDMADAWAAALNEQEKGESEPAPEKAKTDEESMADAWASALNEQENATPSADETKTVEKPKSEEEAMADSWAAALNEQENATPSADETKTVEKPKSEEEAMADSWAAALNDTDSATPDVTPSADEGKTDNTPKSEAEAMAESWAAALNDTDTTDTSVKADDEAIDTDSKDVEPETTDDLTAQENAQSWETEDAPDETPYVDPNEDLLATDDTEDTPVDDADLNTDDSADVEPEIEPTNDPDSEAQAMAASWEKIVEGQDLADEKSTTDSDKKPKTLDIHEQLDDLDELHDPSDEPKKAVSKEKNPDNVDDFLASLDNASDEEIQTEHNVLQEEATIHPSHEAIALEQAFAKAVDTSVPVHETKTVAKPVGANVDEVVNEDLDLESLLNEDSSDDEFDTSVDTASTDDTVTDTQTFDEPTDVDTSDELPSDDEIVTDDVIDDTIPENNDIIDADTSVESVDETPIETDDLADAQTVDETPVEDDNLADVDTIEDAQVEPVDEVSDTVEDTVEDSVEPTDVETPDVSDESNTQDNVSTDDVVSWEVPADDYDVVSASHQANKDVSRTQDTATPDTSDVVDNSENLPSDNLDEESALDDDTEDTQTVDTTDEETSSDKDLAELESRIGSATKMYDPAAEDDLMNMLSSSDETSSNHTNDEPSFDVDDDIAKMIGANPTEDNAESLTDDNQVDVEAAVETPVETPEETPVETEETSTDNLDIPDVDAQEVLPDELENDTISHDQDNVFDKIGPISAIDEDDNSNAVFVDGDKTTDENYEGLTSKEHQYYVDELNLARLYLETGDTEEAIKIIDDVKEHGSSDLKEEVQKIIETYGN